MRGLLTTDGHVHALELVLPENRSVARRLAAWDRGDHPRPLGEWERLFSVHFEPVVVEPYPARAGRRHPVEHGLAFRGRPRR